MVFAKNTASKEQRFSLFHNLTAYAQEYFETEEKLMSRMHVDRRHVKSHIIQHWDFVTDVTSMVASTDANTTEGNQALLDYPVHWLAFHILVIDQNIARQITKIEDGTSPEEAFDIGERQASNSTEPLVTALSGLFALVSKRNKALKDLNSTLETRVTKRTEKLVKASEAVYEAKRCGMNCVKGL